MPPAAGTKALAAVSPAKVLTGGIIISTVDELMSLANVFYRAGAPRGINKPEQIAMQIAYGQEVGLKPCQSVASIMIQNGKPSIYGEAGLGILRSSPLLEPDSLQFDVGGVGDKRYGWCKSKRRGESVIRETQFTLDDAKQAGLYPAKPEAAWTKYTNRMLKWRAIGFHCKDYWSDVLCGIAIYGEEEADAITVEVVSVKTNAGTSESNSGAGGGSCSIPAPTNALPAAPPSSNGTHATQSPPTGPITEEQKRKFGAYKLDYVKSLGTVMTDTAAIAAAWTKFLSRWSVASALDMSAAQADEALAVMYNACHPKEAREVFSPAGQS